MKDNVYAKIHKFFLSEVAEWFPVRQDWIEGYIRQQAWQGSPAQELMQNWTFLAWFLRYLGKQEIQQLADLEPVDYSRFFEWLARRQKTLRLDCAAVDRYCSLLLDVYSFWDQKGWQTGLKEAVRQAQREMTGSGDLRRIVATQGEVMVGDPAAMADSMEQVMVKLDEFYRQPCFVDDLKRALFWYAGPVKIAPEEQADSFWLGFWDYFLFDYHLMADDLTPLQHYKVAEGEKLPAAQQQLLWQLEQAELRVFYIERIANHEWVECKDLFTEELFRLPAPDFDYKQMKKLLFYGHVSAQGMIMINYVVSVKASVKLRRRIRQEILGQYERFCLQQPDAKIRDFFQRQGLVVRHGIDAMISQARLNLTARINSDSRGSGIKLAGEPDAVDKLLGKLMPRYGFSRYDLTLAENCWHDFQRGANRQVRKPELWAFAVLEVFNDNNLLDLVPWEQALRQWQLTPAAVKRNRREIERALAIEFLDPRYLNESGFVFALFMG